MIEITDFLGRLLIPKDMKQGMKKDKLYDSFDSDNILFLEALDKYEKFDIIVPLIPDIPIEQTPEKERECRIF